MLALEKQKNSNESKPKTPKSIENPFDENNSLQKIEFFADEEGTKEINVATENIDRITTGDSLEIQAIKNEALEEIEEEELKFEEEVNPKKAQEEVITKANQAFLNKKALEKQIKNSKGEEKSNIEKELEAQKSIIEKSKKENEILIQKEIKDFLIENPDANDIDILKNIVMPGLKNFDDSQTTKKESEILNKMAIGAGKILPKNEIVRTLLITGTIAGIATIAALTAPVPAVAGIVGASTYFGLKVFRSLVGGTIGKKIHKVAEKGIEKSHAKKMENRIEVNKYSKEDIVDALDNISAIDKELKVL